VQELIKESDTLNRTHKNSNKNRYTAT